MNRKSRTRMRRVQQRKLVKLLLHPQKPEKEKSIQRKKRKRKNLNERWLKKQWVISKHSRNGRKISLLSKNTRSLSLEKCSKLLFTSWSTIENKFVTETRIYFAGRKHISLSTMSFLNEWRTTTLLVQSQRSSNSIKWIISWTNSLMGTTKRISTTIVLLLESCSNGVIWSFKFERRMWSRELNMLSWRRKKEKMQSTKRMNDLKKDEFILKSKETFGMKNKTNWEKKRKKQRQSTMLNMNKRKKRRSFQTKSKRISRSSNKRKHQSKANMNLSKKRRKKKPLMRMKF